MGLTRVGCRIQDIRGSVNYNFHEGRGSQGSTDCEFISLVGVEDCGRSRTVDEVRSGRMFLIIHWTVFQTGTGMSILYETKLAVQGQTELGVVFLML